MIGKFEELTRTLATLTERMNQMQAAQAARSSSSVKPEEVDQGQPPTDEIHTSQTSEASKTMEIATQGKIALVLI